VQGGAQNVRYLHDGRARSLVEAIAWHGGEGEASRRRFEALSADERAAVVAFLDSLRTVVAPGRRPLAPAVKPRRQQAAAPKGDGLLSWRRLGRA